MAETRLAQLQKKVLEALRQWHAPNNGASPFEGLRLYQQTLEMGAANPRQATNQMLARLLETLQTENKQGAELLSRRYLDKEKMYVIANSMNMSEATTYRYQRVAIEQLADKLQTYETNIINERQTRLEKRLERPSYTIPIGVDESLSLLLDLLTNPDAPWLIAVVGMGGIGKTTVADVLLRKVIEVGLFADIGWVSATTPVTNRLLHLNKLPAAMSADQLVEKLVEQLMQDVPTPDRISIQQAEALLKTRLKQKPHLIVIDNLETVQDVEVLLPLLRNLANPSKFLLTSRQNLYEEPGLYHFPLPELSQENSLKLIRHEVTQHNLAQLQQATDDELHKIYETVGGNPLAIRLVVGQAHVFELKDILDDLVASESKTTEELYTFIYWQAWQALGEPARRLFLAFLQIPDEGERLEEVVELVELDKGDLLTAIKHLVDLNLVNNISDQQHRYYHIHNLTRTFLKAQVLKWQ